MRRSLSCLLMLVAAATAGRADTVRLAEQGATVPYGQTREFRFRAGAFRSGRLSLSVRIALDECAGSTHVLGLSLNGKNIRAGVDRRSVRLINKPITARMANGLVLPWFNGTDWRVVYAPDFEMAGAEKAASNRILDVSPYRLVLDVTDLLRPDGENVLALAHRGETMRLRSYFPNGKPSLDLVLDALAMEFSEEPSQVAGASAEEPFHADRLMVQPPAAADAARVVSVQPGGGMRIALPGMSLRLRSRFSYQGGGFNTLAAEGKPEGEPEWRVAVAGSGKERVVTATAREYRLVRRIRFARDHVQFADTLTNLTGADIGLAFDNTIEAPKDAVSQAYLGGNPDPGTESNKGGENPTLFLQGDKSGCGLLAEDDVYRIQGTAYYASGGGIRSDTFALGARASYTVRWRLYPVLRPDYYDFINLARRDLDANFTIPGGFLFGLNGAATETAAALRERLQTRGAQFASSGVWFHRGGDVSCYHGSHMLKAAALRETLGKACANVRANAPGAKSLVYIHAFINTDPDGPRLFPDSRVLLESGEQYENKHYTATCGIPFLYYYPTLENSYWKAMKEVVDMCLDRDKIGADGIYWDEVDVVSVQRTYDRWDGHSALLDAQHRIQKRFADISLLSLPAKVALVRYVREKGGIVIGNSVPTTETLAKVHFPRFVETAAEWYPARAHLYSPIALGDHLTVKDFPTLVEDIRRKLMWGSVYYYYSTPSQPYPTITEHMFPFTPVELHRAWLLGKERILTAVPGTFTFGDRAPVRVYWYDAAGKLTEKTGEERVEGTRRLVRLALGAGEMAAIVRGK